MSEAITKTNQNPESYSPNFPKIVQMMGEINETKIITDITKLTDDGGTKRLTNIRRIRNWENFFLDSAIYSVGVALGISYEDGFAPISAVTGDMFTYMYSDVKPCDSGITNYVYMPEVITDAFSLFGSECFYLSNADIKADFDRAKRFIYESVDCGIPVLAWGMGDVSFKDGSRYDPLPEGCFIGGYNEKEKLLFVNLYPEAERLAETSANGLPGVDEFGYTAIDERKALATTNGLFFITNKIAPPKMRDVYLKALNSIPHWLSLPEKDGYVYGKVAFDKWAGVLLDDSNWSIKELCDANMWNKHCCAYCSICTSIGVGDGNPLVNYLKKAFDEIPEFPNAEKILEHYKQMRLLCQKIWDTHGDFMPPADKMVNHEFRERLAGTLREMGDICDGILSLFN